MNELLRRLLALPEQASTLATELDHLHYAVIGVTMLGSFAVFATALYFTLRYRRRPGDTVTPRIRAPVWLEGGVILGLFGLFLLFWVIGFRLYVRMVVPPDDALPVYVTAKQWMWKFAYPGGRTAIGTLVVPAGRPVKLVMTSRDVIHSFFAPSYRIKQDVLPGRYTLAWIEAKAPGTSPIYCAEYCGLNHSQMWGEIVALAPADYEAWEAGTSPEAFVATAAATTTMVERGRAVAADRGCLSCHTLDGQRHIGPSWRGLWQAPVTLADGTTVIADEAYLTRSMMDPAAQVVAGFAPVMPTYQGLLEPAEVGALLELIRSIGPARPAPPDVQLPALTPGSPPR